MRSSRLYLATRSERESDPVLIWPHPEPTARSAIVVSSVSPDRCETTTAQPASADGGRSTTPQPDEIQITSRLRAGLAGGFQNELRTGCQLERCEDQIAARRKFRNTWYGDDPGEIRRVAYVLNENDGRHHVAVPPKNDLLTCLIDRYKLTEKPTTRFDMTDAERAAGHADG